MSLTVTQGKVKEKEYKILGNGRLSQGLAFLVYQPLKGNKGNGGSGCNVRTQDPENFDEEVKSLVTAWRSRFDLFITARHSLSLFCWTIFLDSSFLHFGPTEEKKG